MPDKDKGLLQQLQGAFNDNTDAPATTAPSDVSSPAAPPVANNSNADILSQWQQADNADVSRETSDLDEQIGKTESGGNYSATNPNSTATGKHQFLWSKFGDQIKSVTGVKNRREFLDSPDKQEQFFQYHVKNNLLPSVEHLKQFNNAGYSDVQLAKLVHFKGEGGAKQWLQDHEDDTTENNMSIDGYVGKPGADTQPKPMTAVVNNAPPEAAQDDLSYATDVMSKYLGPGFLQSAKQNLKPVSVVGVSKKGNMVQHTYDPSNGSLKIDVMGAPQDATLNKNGDVAMPKTGITDNSPIDHGMEVADQTQPTPRNLEAARGTIKTEVAASNDYLNKFITDNQQDLSNYPALTGNFSGQGKVNMTGTGIQVNDPTSIQSKVLNPNGDVATLSNFTNTSLNLLEQRKKADMAALQSKHPVVHQNYGRDEFGVSNDVTYRQDEPAYNKELDDLNKNYNTQKSNLLSAVNNVANLKVANDFINKNGSTHIVTDKDYLNMGLDVAKAMGQPDIEKKINYANTGRLSPEESVQYKMMGAAAMRYKTMEAVGNGQDAVAKNLQNTNLNFKDKILNSEPEFKKQQVVNAISDEWYKMTNGRPTATSIPGAITNSIIDLGSGDILTQEKIGEIAQKLRLRPQDVQNITPEDIKREPNILQSWVGGVNEAAGHVYEFAARHPLIAGLPGYLLNANRTDEQLDKDYAPNWWENRGIGGSFMTGTPAPNASSMFGAGSQVDTNPDSDNYLQNMANPDAGKFNLSLRKYLHSSASMLGNITAFAGGAGAIGEGLQGAGVINDAAKAEKYGTAAMMVLQNHDANMRTAREAIPGDEPEDHIKQALMGSIYTGLDIASIEAFSPLDLKNKIFGGSNVAGNDILKIIKNEGIEGLQYNKTFQTKMTSALKEAGIDWAKMTGGMTAAQVGKELTDFVLAPDKYKNEDPMTDVKQTAISNAVLNVIPSLGAGIGHANRESGIRSMLPYEVGSNPRTYLDAIEKMVEKGSVSHEKAADMTNTVNALADIVKNTPTESVVTGNELSANQKSEYTSSLLNEEIANQQKSKTKDKVLQRQLDEYIKNEQGKRTEIMKVVDTPVATKEETTGSSDKNQQDGKNDEAQETKGQEGDVLSTPQAEATSKDGQGDQPVAPPSVSETPAEQEKQNTITIGELIGKDVMYKGKPAELYKDGNAIVAAPKDGSPEWELGRADEIGDHSISDYGIEEKKAKVPSDNTVSVADNGNYVVRGKEYENRYSDPTAAINYNEDGERTSVTLHTADGKPRTFKGDVGESLAYQIHLREIDKANETGALEDFINNTPDIREDIEAAKHDNESEPAIGESAAEHVPPAGQHVAGESTSKPVATVAAEPGPTEPTKQVDNRGSESSDAQSATEAPAKISRRKAEKKQKEEVSPDLFTPRKKVAPEYDFEDEPDHKSEPAATPEAVAQETPVVHQSLEPDKEPTGDLFAQPQSMAAQPVQNELKLPSTALPSAPGNNNASTQQQRADAFFNAQRTPDEDRETAKVGGAIRKRFNDAEKVVGNRHMRTLEDGTTIPGHYVMVDAKGVTPSNDPNSMRMSEGFPTLEDGRNPNDRDYTQPANEANVRKRANDYDSRALQNIPTVDKNGVVIDGNDRTMSGQMAADNGKDGKYYQALKQTAHNYGFTEDQVKDMKARSKNPRVVFVPDAISPYTTETFAKFNPRIIGKAKTPIEEAIQLGRTAPQKMVDAIGRQMNGYERVSDFFADKNATKNVADLLEQHGIFNSDSKNAFYNAENRTFTPEGKELLQNMMLGKAFNEPTLRLLQNHPDMREKMLFAMNNVMGIEALGEKYSLKKHISDALGLWDRIESYREQADLPATEEGRNRASEQYLAQQDMFGGKPSMEAQIIWEDMNSKKKSSLRELTKSYLRAATEHGAGVDMFGNEPASREALLEQYAKNKEDERQLFESARKATGERDERPEAGPIQQETIEDTEASPQRKEGESTEPGAERAEFGQTDTEHLSVEEPSATYSTEKNPTKADIPELQKKKYSQLTPAEKDLLYKHDQEQFEKYDELAKTKQARVSDLRDQLEELEHVNKDDTPEYKELKRQLSGNENRLSDAKRQRALAADGINRYEGKRAGDALRELANKGIADNLMYSSPAAPIAKAVKALLKLVANGLDAGWNLRHAIRRAIADHRAADPEFNHFIEEHPDNENITSNWLHKEAVGKVNEKENIARPDIGSAKNKQLADVIIGRIKNGETTLEEAQDAIHDNDRIKEETKKRLIDYLEYYTEREDQLLRDRNNSDFLDHYKPRASEELRKFSSGATLEDVFGETPHGDQTYMTDKLHLMLNDAEEQIGLAQHHWGEKITQYGPKLMDYLNAMSRDEGVKKGQLLATYLGKLHEARLRGEGDQGTMKNLLANAEQAWQKYINGVGKELNTARLLRVFRDHNLSEFYGDKILSEKQRRAKETVSQALTNEKISDDVMDKGVLRDQADVIREEKERSAENKKDEAVAEASPKKSKKQDTRDKEEFSAKAKAKLNEIKDPKQLTSDIIEKIKNIKC